MAIFCSVDYQKYVVQYLTVFAATLGMLADGMQFGWTSPASAILLSSNSPIKMTKNEVKWISLWYILGCSTGVLLSFPLFSKISRKFSIFLSCIPIMLGWIGILLANSALILHIARFIAGIGRNMIYVAVPMYIGEIADPKIRGILGGFIYTMMNLGVLSVYCIAPYNSITYTAIIGLSISVITLIIVSLIPQSPYYSLARNNFAAARKSIQILRRSNDVEDELKTLYEIVTKQMAAKKNQFSNALKLFTVKSNRKALAILLTLRFLQMMSGVSVMTMHVHRIFEQAGGNLRSDISAIIYAVMMVCSCFSSLITADKFGRKSLMIFSSLATATVLISQGTFYFVNQHTSINLHYFMWLPLLNIVGFVFSYRVGLGTIPMVMVSELFPNTVKVPGVVLTDLMYSVTSFLSNLLFQYTEDTLGMYTPFWIYGAMCIFSALFSWQCLPETKGKSLEEIQEILEKKSDDIKIKTTNDIC